MSALAVVLSSLEKHISGVDLPTEQQTQTHKLLAKYPQITVHEGFSADHITSDIDLVIAPAVHHGENNEEVKQARSLGIPVLYYAEALGALMDLHTHKISVCGTHGKTTTTTLVAHVMHALGLPSTHIIGASNKNMDSGVSTGREYIVVESDEYAVAAGIDPTPKFMKLNPDYILCTSLEQDHADIYPTEESYVTAFKSYFAKIPQSGKVLYCADVPLLHAAVEGVEKHQTISFGLSEGADVRAQDVHVTSEGTQFRCLFADGTSALMMIPLYGSHSVSNCVGVLALSKELGWDMKKVVEALRTFPGLERRFELVYSDDHFDYLDDYAHHPGELEAVIGAVHTRYAGRRVIAVFQPHTYSRTKEFLQGFVDALRKVDRAFVLDIYGASRENSEDFDISSQTIEDTAVGQGIATIEYVPVDECLTRLAAILHEGDVILTLGAGDATYYLREDIVALLESHFILR